MAEKLGIIQSRGLGDIIIALPIAHYYYKEGYEILWPICEEFVSNFEQTAPWVKWIPIPTDKKGNYFYNEPIARIKNLGCDQALPLYQSLTGHPEFVDRPWFQVAKFDQYKYHTAEVPFLEKWKLNECITRNPGREQALYDKLVKKENYVVYHVKGSSYTAPVDLTLVPDDWQRIEINEQTDCVFDWLKIIENSQALICVDSVISNMVDQMNLTESTDCYWIPRSHIHLTPVLGGNWTILDVPADRKKAITVFQST